MNIVTLAHSPIGDRNLWKDHPATPEGKLVHVVNAPIHLALLEGGTEAGRHSVMIKVDLGEQADGKVLLLEMTADNFLNAAIAFQGWIARDKQKQN